MIDTISQIGVVVFGLSSLYLAGSSDTRSRMWAGICGLLGEPFWMATAIVNEQIGVMVLAVVYSIGYCRMYWNNR